MPSVWIVLKTRDTPRLNAKCTRSSTITLTSVLSPRERADDEVAWWRLDLAHFDRDRQKMDDHVSATVLVAFDRLRAAFRIGCPCNQRPLSRFLGCLPIKFPKPPRVRFRFAE